jgi:large subunit ribosomal protein L3
MDAYGSAYGIIRRFFSTEVAVGPSMTFRPRWDHRRTGVLAYKLGMSVDWDTWGQRIPLTVLKLDKVQVTQVKTKENEGYYALQLGIGRKQPKNVALPLRMHFQNNNIECKRRVREFQVTSPDALLPVGTEITVNHFVAGQYVDIRGITIGKGFQGAMKRWGFRGLPASHGVSLSHRSLGSTGSRQGSGKTFKGKKMPGHMGCKNATMECLQIYRIDPLLNTLYIRGSVPGHAYNVVEIRDSIKKQIDEALPFPTQTHSPTRLVAEPRKKDPLIAVYTDPTQ